MKIHGLDVNHLSKVQQRQYHKTRMGDYISLTAFYLQFIFIILLQKCQLVFRLTFWRYMTFFCARY